MTNDVLKKYNLTKNAYFFVTSHRASNEKNPAQLYEILKALQILNTPTIFPAHPRTKKIVEENNFKHLINPEILQFIEPIGFFETQTLIANAKMVLTDSGGVTKESYFHQKRCVILQEQIEWLEIVDEGWAKCCAPQSERIVEAATNFDAPKNYGAQLGNGNAAEIIINAIKKFFEA